MSEYNLERLNFLIVDDNRHMRALVKTILHALGCKNVVEASDGADAFKELKHFAADIIICDWNMDPLDGIDFTRLVRTGADSPNPFVPIIMLTGHTEMNKVTEARDAGVHEFLAKPIAARGLYARIKAIIEKPRAFVRSKTYFGPDRRRKDSPQYNGPDRRTAGDDAGMAGGTGGGMGQAEQQDDGPNLSQDEIEALLNG
ncbi:MAG: response regulator [Magnetovibrionaceae bacterium]